MKEILNLAKFRINITIGWTDDRLVVSTLDDILDEFPTVSKTVNGIELPSAGNAME